MNCFIPDSDIKKKILQELPIPENLTYKNEMDSNIKSLLLEKKAKETLTLDKDFCSMQEKNGYILGPLIQIWYFLEGQKKAAHEQISQIEDDIPEDVIEMLTTAKDCCYIMDMSIAMIEQTFNSLSYYSGRNALMAIMGDKTKGEVFDAGK